MLRHARSVLMAPRACPALAAAARFHGVQTRMAVSFGLAFVLILVVVELIGFFGRSADPPWSGRMGRFQGGGRRRLGIDRRPEGGAAPLDGSTTAGRTWPSSAGGPVRGRQMQSVLKDVENLTAEGLRTGPLWTRLRQQMAIRGDQLPPRGNVKHTFPDCRRIVIAEAKSGKIIASTPTPPTSARTCPASPVSRGRPAPAAISRARCAG